MKFLNITSYEDAKLPGSHKAYFIGYGLKPLYKASQATIEYRIYQYGRFWWRRNIFFLYMHITAYPNRAYLKNLDSHYLIPRDLSRFSRYPNILRVFHNVTITQLLRAMAQFQIDVVRLRNEW